MHDLESYASGQPGIYDLVDSRTMTCINAEMVEGLKYGGRGTELCQTSLCCFEIFTDQFDRKGGIQGLMCHFSKNQKPGQSCHPSIGLMAVLKQK